MNKSLIVAIDKNGGISKNGVIPWKIKEDMNFFIDVTKRQYIKGLPNVLIMGKNTWLSCRDTLKNRIIIVVSSTVNVKKYNDTYIFNKLSDALDEANVMYNKYLVGHIFICGGSKIYEEAMNYEINTIYLSTIDYDYNCDNCININIEKYSIFSSNTFNVNDLINDKKINVTFKKLYLTLPDHWNNCEERQYLNLLNEVLTTGDFRQTRNSKTWSIFGKRLEFDMNKGFPLLTTKSCFTRGIFEELMFFINGDTNTKHLEDKGVTIWTKNTSREFLDSVGLNHYNEGDMGPLYSFNFNHYGADYKGMNESYDNQGLNQFDYCLDLLKNDPYSRRIIMTSYNPTVAKQAPLFPCHSLMLQWYVEGNKLSLSCYNRSQDSFLGLCWNHISFSMLMYMFCEIINNDINYKNVKLTPGRLIVNMGDVHIYEDHKEAVIRQILRDPYHAPTFKINRKVTKLTDFKYEDIEIIDYQCYPAITAKMIA
jgi:dihydrofolate reductase / thymidylate synthase